MSQLAWKVRAAVPAGRVTWRFMVWVKLLPLPLHQDLLPVAGGTRSVMTCFFGSVTTRPWALFELYSCGPSSTARVWPAATIS
jgi:hypothetical protein